MIDRIEYHNLHLEICKEVGDKHGEGCAYGSLGIAYDSVGDFKKALNYHNLHLEIKLYTASNYVLKLVKK